MKWHKLGQIFVPDHNFPWMVSHAANTVALPLIGDSYRIYFSTRNSDRQAHIGFVDIDLSKPREIKRISKTPALMPGDIGLFDDSGVSLSCITQVGGQVYMYYLGWNLGVTVPFRNHVGLAIYDEAHDTYSKYTNAPILDRSAIDPYCLSYPFVLKDDSIYRMWYGSNLSWGSKQEDMEHIIKYAESEDGINWVRHGHVALSFKNADEYAMSRPCVIKENGLYKMWYSYRGQSYRIGYAESKNAVDWVRKDEEVGIDVSQEGWDSEMICYPFIFDHNNKRYMLYNGNGYGKTGFGLAVLQ